MTNTVDVAVIGGGVTGLAAALRLRAIVPRASVTVIEAGAKLGGKLCGEVIDDCVIDGGPDLCLESKLSRAHAFDELGIASELIPVNPAGLPTFRRSGGELHAMPRVLTEGLVTMRSGMHDMVNLMASAIRDVDLRLGVRVLSVERAAGSWTLGLSDAATLEASAVICALPATASARLFADVFPRFAEAASRVTYVPMTTVSAAWAADEVPKELHGTGFIEDVPADGALTACTWTTSKIPMRSPYDVILLRGYVRSADTERATRIAVEEMSGFLGVCRKPLWTRAFSWSDAVPQYPVDHAETVRDLRAELEQHADFAFGGAAWDGIGIGDCMCSGERAAERIAAALQPV